MLAGGEGWGEGVVRESGIDMCTLFHLKWITNKDLQYSTWNSAQCCVEAWMGGASEGEWIHVYVWLGPFPVYLKLPQHCLLIGYVLVLSPFSRVTPWTVARQAPLSMGILQARILE